ncbi:MAG TPA: hypothetical protein DD420_10050, partial [Streptomyces sp.]|nr:hypothetical protein [Streptomyces sp.]
LGSTNGTTLDGAPVHDRPLRLAPGALLRLGESTLRLTTGSRTPALTTTPDGEGHLRVARTDTGSTATPPGDTEDPGGPAGSDSRGGAHRAGPDPYAAYDDGAAGHGEDPHAPRPQQVTHGRGTPLTPGDPP